MRGGLSWVVQASVGLWLCGGFACSSGLDTVQYEEAAAGSDHERMGPTAAAGESSTGDAGPSSDNGLFANDSGAGGHSGRGGGEQGGMHTGGQGGVNTGGQGGVNTGGQGGVAAGGEGGTGGAPEVGMDAGVGGALVDSGGDGGVPCPASPVRVERVKTVSESAVRSGELEIVSVDVRDELEGNPSTSLRAGSDQVLPNWIDVLAQLTPDLRLELHALASEEDTVETFATEIRIARKDGCTILRIGLTVEVQ